MQHILANYSSPSILCSASAVAPPIIFGTEILNLSATLLSNYSVSYSEALNYNSGNVKLSNANFCNITITYTHPGQNDTINSETWIPMDNFNGKMLGVGGGGWVAGRFILSYASMAHGISEGYAVTTTDAGVPSDSYSDASQWALLSPGNVNTYKLQNLGYASLNETAYLAKALIKDFYGQLPTYSYFSGCSQGGRQGMMLAQRYPEAYDGIAASAPAMNWNEMLSTGYWGQLLMQQSGHFPRACEVQAITNAAVEKCDPLDGVTDGLVSHIDACTFDPLSVVGREFNCSDTNSNMTISLETAQLVNNTWIGAIDIDGKPIWYGPTMEANLTGEITTPLNTICSSNNTCTGSPISLFTDWLKFFILKDINADVSNLTQQEFARMYHSSVLQYDSVIGTRSADLSAFKARGGKLISYHGLADPIIPTFGSRNYYDRVADLDPTSHSFFRLFEVPGLGHCYNGPGAYPNGTLNALISWVEDGVVPDTLTGYRPADKTGFRTLRKLCPYPQRTVYDGSGNIDSLDSYSCA